KIPGKAWPEYRFATCSQCGKFHRSIIASSEVPTVCECGQSLTEGAELSGPFVQPIFGFRTALREDGQEPVDVRPQRTFPTRVFFSHYLDQLKETNNDSKKPFALEGSPDLRSGLHIQKRYAHDGVLIVVNPGRQKQGFWLCPRCGY